MLPLSSELRGELEKAVLNARAVSEAAAGAALVALAVDQERPFATMDDGQRRLRRALRARAKQLGNGSRTAGFQPLVEEVAYAQWHRMLFARFLAENHLLIHPGAGIPVTIGECADLAAEEGEADAWALASRYAGAMLPGIFRADDPAVQVRFAPEGRTALEAILANLPPAVFTADDALGWVYQFWQTQRKKEVSGSGRKIGAADLSAYTQLFTEDYMVRFLLENSLGAWWAGRHPGSPLLCEFEYLRFREDGTPAAGTFPGWPARAAEVTVMDPCCGSGHFLVAAFEMLRRMCMEEEGLTEREAADAVLRNNLFGLELDPRCTQIAAFSLALAAWKAGGYRPLPLPNIACSGIAVEGQLEEWTKLAGDDEQLCTAMERLYYLFCNAPDLGSLINPADVPLKDRMFTPDYTQVAPFLERALGKEISVDPSASVFGSAVVSVAHAARLLARTYTLVATNVPYLGFKKQDEVLKEFAKTNHPTAKMDLAAVFVERCRCFTALGGTQAIVTPQNWLSLGSYKHLRPKMLREQTWHHVSWLGPGAFKTISGEVVKPVLLILSNELPASDQMITGIDASRVRTAQEKALLLRQAPLETVVQSAQLRNPEARVSLKITAKGTLLRNYAFSPRGIVTGDSARWIRCFWEVSLPFGGWRYLQSTVETPQDFGGREQIVDWSSNGRGMLRPGLGNQAYGCQGVLISQMGSLPCTLYSGDLYDNNCAPIIPRDPKHLPAIWAFCRSPQFNEEVRRLDKKVNVTNATLVKIPFDLQYWQEIAGKAEPLPRPYSNDPTQWLFEGNPVDSTEPLQVAVARLLDYRWPQQKDDELYAYGDEDGIVCLPPVAGEQPAAERLRALLAAAYGEEWVPAEQERLLAAAGFAGKTLDVWLRDGFFKQHCALFHNRPFIWHIWDGRRDGFSALVNYHKLDAARLDKLIYTYLGTWIATQRAAADQGETGADGRLVAALELQRKLEAIRDGEPPYDIYVRWKPPHEQPIGWNPDLNDGVRLNIRPFVTAGVLRSRFTVNWNKDRGTNPDGSERLNDLHYTRAEKLAARAAVHASHSCEEAAS